MTRSQLTDSISRILADHFGVELSDVTPETRLTEDLGSDSLDCVELTMAIEDDFEIFIDDDEADAAKTVSQIVDLIAKKVEGTPE